MKQYRLSHHSDAALLRELKELSAQDRAITAMLLAHIAEVDARRLYVPAGYPSMFAYCMEELRLSEDSAYKRIRAARAARRFPILFTAVSDGRLHLAAVCLITSHLTEENVDELIEAAAHRRRAEIEHWLARRFPGEATSSRADAPAMIRPVSPSPRMAASMKAGELPLLAEGSTPDELAPGPVGSDSNTRPAGRSDSASDGIGQIGEGTMNELAGAARLTAAAESVRHTNTIGHANTIGHTDTIGQTNGVRFVVRLTIEEKTHDKLRRAQALLSHVIPIGDVSQLLDRALDALLDQLERRKLGATARGSVQGDGVNHTERQGDGVSQGRRQGDGVSQSSGQRDPANQSPPQRDPVNQSPPQRDRANQSQRQRDRANQARSAYRRRLAAKGRSKPRNRYIPAPIRRAVWERDRGQCTFIGRDGHRCGARQYLEFDHVQPVARGGRATVEGMRLRCRAHNQYEAERIFGAEFMSRKRREARQSVPSSVAPDKAQVLGSDRDCPADTARVEAAYGPSADSGRAAVKGEGPVTSGRPCRVGFGPAITGPGTSWQRLPTRLRD